MNEPPAPARVDFRYYNAGRRAGKTTMSVAHPFVTLPPQVGGYTGRPA
jgi:hypothetical protein